LGSQQLASLWRHYFHSHDDGAREVLIQHYMEFARIMAASLYKLRATNAVAFDDYLQYARTGLLEAIDRYDPAREVKFETFAAIRIRGSILNGLECETEQAAQNKARDSVALSERLHSIYGANVKVGVSQPLDTWVNAVVSVAMGVLLDDAQDHPSDERSAANPYASVELLYLRKQLVAHVDKLSPREAAVIRMHYFEQEEFQLIAEQLKISKGRVSQLHGQALNKLKRFLTSQAKTRLDL